MLPINRGIRFSLEKKEFNIVKISLKGLPDLQTMITAVNIVNCKVSSFVMSLTQLHK